MKKIFAIVLAIYAINIGAKAQNNFFDDANAFFAKNVKSGLVDYKAIHTNRSTLDALAKQVASYPVSQANASKRKAFFINAYNVLVIKSIIDHYPTKSPMKVNGFFDGIKHKVAGKNLTLNQLEKGKLLKTTKDARLHFVLVCAAVSCPKIANFAYMPDKLEGQIEKQTKLALNDSKFIRPQGNKVLVSEIFNWYKADFVNDAGSVAKYLNKYRSSKLAKGTKIGFYTYDWTLNTL